MPLSCPQLCNSLTLAGREEANCLAVLFTTCPVPTATQQLTQARCIRTQIWRVTTLSRIESNLWTDVLLCKARSDHRRHGFLLMCHLWSMLPAVLGLLWKKKKNKGFSLKVRCFLLVLALTLICQPDSRSWTKMLMYKQGISTYGLCATAKESSSFLRTAATCLLWNPSSRLGWRDTAPIRVKRGINSTNSNLGKWPDYHNHHVVLGNHQQINGSVFLSLRGPSWIQSEEKQQQSSHQAWEDLSAQLDSPTAPHARTRFKQLFLLIINFAKPTWTQRQKLRFSFDKAQKGNFGDWDDFQKRK